MPDGIRPSYQMAGQWLLAKDVNDATNVLAVNCTTFVTGGTTVTALLASVFGAGGAGGSDVNIVGPTTSSAGFTRVVLVSDIAAAAGISNVTAHQGSSGTEAWPVQFLAAQSVHAIQSGAWAVAANITAGNVGISSAPAFSVIQSGVWAVNAVQSGAWAVAANITAGNVGISSAPALSISTLPVVNVGTLPTVNVGTIGPIVAVQPRVTGNPSTVTFSLTQSSTAVVTLVASTNGSRIVIKAYGVFNGDSATHGFQVLASNTVVIPAFLAGNGGGHNIAFADPYPLVSNAGLNISLVGAVGANAVVGYFEVAMVPN